MFYAYPQINRLMGASRSLINKQGHGDDILGTLVLVCSALVFSFLSLTFLVWKQKLVSQVLTKDLQTLLGSFPRSPARAAHPHLRKDEPGLR